MKVLAEEGQRIEPVLELEGWWCEDWFLLVLVVVLLIIIVLIVIPLILYDG